MESGYVVAKHVATLRGEFLGYLSENDNKGQEDFLRVRVLFAPGVSPLQGSFVVEKKDIRPATVKDFDRFRCSIPKDFQEKTRSSPQDFGER